MAELAAAEARRSAILAVLAAEQLEDEGAKATGSASWTEAARTASAAQRSQAKAEAQLSCLRATRDSGRAERTLDGLLARRRPAG